MSDHADYCPIASAVEVLGDRWTPLVIRELMVGATGFNEGPLGSGVGVR